MGKIKDLLEITPEKIMALFQKEISKLDKRGLEKKLDDLETALSRSPSSMKGQSSKNKMASIEIIKKLLRK